MVEWATRKADLLVALGTWALVLVTVGLALATIVAIKWQIRSLQTLESARMLFSLRDRYESLRLRKQRRRLAELLSLKDEGHLHRDDDVLVFFDTLGDLAHREVLSSEMVWYEFCWDVTHYFSALERSGWIRRARDKSANESLYREFEWLYNRLREIDANRRGLSVSQVIVKESEVERFLEDEKSLDDPSS